MMLRWKGEEEKKKRGKEKKGNEVLIFAFSRLSTTQYSLCYISTSECLMEMHILSLSVLSGLTVGVLREVPVRLTG